jgi:hypothetical protein
MPMGGVPWLRILYRADFEVKNVVMRALLGWFIKQLLVKSISWIGPTCLDWPASVVSWRLSNIEI